MSTNDRYARELGFGVSMTTLSKLASSDTKTKLIKMFVGPTSTHKLYCDMDGVLTDFLKRYMDFRPGEPPSSYQKLSPQLVSQPEFWSEMDWNAGGKALWDFIKDLEPTILSANPSYSDDPVTEAAVKPHAEEGKRAWCAQNLGLGPNSVIIEVDKKSEISRTGSGKICVLIDDLMSNLREWESAGGIGILHLQASPTYSIGTLSLLAGDGEGAEL